jgi:hypothetical protein
MPLTSGFTQGDSPSAGLILVMPLTEGFNLQVHCKISGRSLELE